MYLPLPSTFASGGVFSLGGWGKKVEIWVNSYSLQAVVFIDIFIFLGIY